MFPTAHPSAVSDYLLTEVSTSGAFPDPMLFAYGTGGIVLTIFLVLAYLAVGRQGPESLQAPTRQAIQEKSASPKAVHA